jgi:hypothetical protein
MRGISPSAQDKWIRRAAIVGQSGSIGEPVADKPQPTPTTKPSQKVVPFTKRLIYLIGGGMVYGGSGFRSIHSSLVSFNKTATKVARDHQISVTEMLGKSREKRLVLARQELMHELSGLGFGLSAIGRRMNLDHTTVLHGLRAHAKRKAS